MRCIAVLTMVAFLLAAAPTLAIEEVAPAVTEAAPMPTAPQKKKRVCSETFETGSLVKSQKSCRAARKPKAEAASAPVSASAPVPASTTASGTP